MIGEASQLTFAFLPFRQFHHAACGSRPCGRRSSSAAAVLADALAADAGEFGTPRMVSRARAPRWLHAAIVHRRFADVDFAEADLDEIAVLGDEESSVRAVLLSSEIRFSQSRTSRPSSTSVLRSEALSVSSGRADAYWGSSAHSRCSRRPRRWSRQTAMLLDPTSRRPWYSGISIGCSAAKSLSAICSSAFGIPASCVPGHRRNQSAAARSSRSAGLPAARRRSTYRSGRSAAWS